MTPEDFARWEDLASAATAPPWRPLAALSELEDHAWEEIATLAIDSVDRPIQGLGDQVIVVQGLAERVSSGSRFADAAFIAAARDAVPALLRRVRELEEQLARVRATAG